MREKPLLAPKMWLCQGAKVVRELPTPGKQLPPPQLLCVLCCVGVVTTSDCEIKLCS